MTNTELKERLEQLINELEEMPKLGVTLKSIRQNLIAAKLKALNLIRDEMILANQTFKNETVEPMQRPIKIVSSDNIKKPKRK